MSQKSEKKTQNRTVVDLLAVPNCVHVDPGALKPASRDALLMSRADEEARDYEWAYEQFRKIELQAALHDMLHNDPVLSEFDPDEVLKAYEELSAMAPKAASHPGVIRDFLRKRMTAGHLEPFDVAVLLGIEEDLNNGIGATVLLRPFLRYALYLLDAIDRRMYCLSSEN